MGRTGAAPAKIPFRVSQPQPVYFAALPQMTDYAGGAAGLPHVGNNRACQLMQSVAEEDKADTVS